jgi:hypothetical protein
VTSSVPPSSVARSRLAIVPTPGAALARVQAYATIKHRLFFIVERLGGTNPDVSAYDPIHQWLTANYTLSGEFGTGDVIVYLYTPDRSRRRRPRRPNRAQTRLTHARVPLNAPASVRESGVA